MTKVVRGNGGDIAGVRVGDVILAVNGTSVREHQQCVEFIEKRCRVGDCQLTLKARSHASELLRRGSSALLHGLASAVRPPSPFRARRGGGALLRGIPPSEGGAGGAAGGDTPRADSPAPPGSPMAIDSPRISPRSSPRNSPFRTRVNPAVEAVRPSPLALHAARA